MRGLTLTGTIPSFASNTARINGVRIHYLLGGNPNGLPVLLWHGFLSTSHAWRKVMPALASADAFDEAQKKVKPTAITPPRMYFVICCLFTVLPLSKTKIPKPMRTVCELPEPFLRGLF
jgi:hypothetical protein